MPATPRQTEVFFFNLAASIRTKSENNVAKPSRTKTRVSIRRAADHFPAPPKIWSAMIATKRITMGTAIPVQEANARDLERRSDISGGAIFLPNVELIRVNDGASRALHETCLRKTPDPVIG
jgi:hypothetical protein